MTEHDIDWDCDEAQGCDWVLCEKKYFNALFFNNEPVIIDDYWDVDRKPFVKYFNLYKRPEKKDEPENIYTQAMFDAGELPKIGMIVESKGSLNPMDTDWVTENREVLGIYKGENSEVPYLIVQSFSHSHGVELLSCWSPADTRTDKQKLSDQIDKYVIDKNINAIDTDKFIDAIINGDFENLEYTGEK